MTGGFFSFGVHVIVTTPPSACPTPRQIRRHSGAESSKLSALRTRPTTGRRELGESAGRAESWSPTTGAHPWCVTEDGAFDMMGNLHEWTADPAGTFRGGFFVDTVINRPGCTYATTAHDRSHWDYSTGFRCCADPL